MYMPVIVALRVALRAAQRVKRIFFIGHRLMNDAVLQQGIDRAVQGYAVKILECLLNFRIGHGFLMAGNGRKQFQPDGRGLEVSVSEQMREIGVRHNR